MYPYDVEKPFFYVLEVNSLFLAILFGICGEDRIASDDDRLHLCGFMWIGLLKLTNLKSIRVKF